jgi:hypothetical protein
LQIERRHGREIAKRISSRDRNPAEFPKTEVPPDFLRKHGEKILPGLAFFPAIPYNISCGATSIALIP